jgi:hypothetical protein
MRIETGNPLPPAPPPALRGEDPFDVAEEAKRAPPIDANDDLFRGLTPAESWQGPSQPDNADAPPANFDEPDIDALLGDTPPGQPLPATAPVAAPAAPPANFDELDIDALLGDTPPGQPPPRLPAPPEALQAWLAAAEISTGPIFRPVGKGDRVSAGPLAAFSAAEIVKHYATRAGLDPAGFAGHSLARASSHLPPSTARGCSR